jgi:hypothetical protein
MNISGATHYAVLKTSLSGWVTIRAVISAATQETNFSSRAQSDHGGRVDWL